MVVKARRGDWVAAKKNWRQTLLRRAATEPAAGEGSVLGGRGLQGPASPGTEGPCPGCVSAPGGSASVATVASEHGFRKEQADCQLCAHSDREQRKRGADSHNGCKSGTNAPISTLICLALTLKVKDKVKLCSVGEIFLVVRGAAVLSARTMHRKYTKNTTHTQKRNNTKYSPHTVIMYEVYLVWYLEYMQYNTQIIEQIIITPYFQYSIFSKQNSNLQEYHAVWLLSIHHLIYFVQRLASISRAHRAKAREPSLDRLPVHHREHTHTSLSHQEESERGRRRECRKAQYQEKTHTHFQHATPHGKAPIPTGCFFLWEEADILFSSVEYITINIVWVMLFWGGITLHYFIVAFRLWSGWRATLRQTCFHHERPVIRPLVYVPLNFAHTRNLLMFFLCCHKLHIFTYPTCLVKTFK